MALPNIPVPKFPNIPNLPGVPPIARNPLQQFAAISPLFADAVSAVLGVKAPQWGIYDSSGSPVLIGDSCVAVEYSKEYRISDYPIEGGLFQSYNKVEMPFDARVTLTKSGTDADRADFLSTLDGICASIDAYTIVTPTVTYIDANPTHYDYRRESAKGVQLLTVEITLQQIRVTAAPAFTHTATPGGASTINDGAVQTTTPTPMQAAATAGGTH